MFRGLSRIVVVSLNSCTAFCVSESLFHMPKAASKARQVKTTQGKATSGKPTFKCACTGGCEGRTRELSGALYKRHAKFRELDEATEKGNIDELSFPQRENIQHSQHDESVSFQNASQSILLKHASI